MRRALMRTPSISVLIIFIDLTFGLKNKIFRITPSLFSQRGLHLSSRSSPLREEEGNRPTRCSEPLRSKVGGPSKVYAMFCGMGPPGA